MLNNIKAFKKFLSDEGVNSPDMYLSREREDFSPEAAINVSHIDSFASEQGCYEYIYDLIA